MKRFVQIIRSVLWIVSGALVLAGCERKEILCPGSEPYTIDVRFMWDAAPEASVDGMTVYFYPTDEYGRMWRFDIAGRDGGPVELPLGRYRMLAVNNDLPGITFSDGDMYDRLQANARRIDTSGLTGSTGMLYRGVVYDVDVTICGVGYTRPDGSVKECPFGVVRCYPDSLATVYDVTLTGVVGMDRVRSASAALGGIASSVSIASGKTGDEVCRSEMQLQPWPETGMMTGRTMGLGTPSGTPRFGLTVTVRCNDGKTLRKEFDVTDQVTGSPDPRNVHIIINGLEIPDTGPDTPPEDVGMIVGVDGWQVIDIDYNTEV